MFNSSLAQEMESFLELRNSYVHQKNTSFYNDVKIHSLLEDVDVILDKLKKYCK